MAVAITSLNASNNLAPFSCPYLNLIFRRFLKKIPLCPPLKADFVTLGLTVTTN
ncbi:hypothetical protein ADICYQ_3709 [Cyclobacterium qasimii M12-11B]|uniref:Uncharacterized protein n=1 Tax=Cyclobacterium qasimii M12-11B TaxID=641524 RepID=S7WT96_9BACT|nr:hypothetical protein ADICYQ_3709 [Cyclobacterium qasimii M12-11B]